MDTLIFIEKYNICGAWKDPDPPNYGLIKN